MAKRFNFTLADADATFLLDYLLCSSTELRLKINDRLADAQKCHYLPSSLAYVDKFDGIMQRVADSQTEVDDSTMHDLDIQHTAMPGVKNGY